MPLGTAKRKFGKTVTSCHLVRAAKTEFGKVATSCQLELLKKNFAKLLQAAKAAERELGETATRC